jgi:hypothetical protein
VEGVYLRLVGEAGERDVASVASASVGGTS